LKFGGILDKPFSIGNLFAGVFGQNGGSREHPKPPYSLVFLIAKAIRASPNRKLKISGIKNYISTNFPYYGLLCGREKDKWEKYVSDDLTNCLCFVQFPKEDGDREKGSYWYIGEF
jgi:hypothetical protein